MRSRRRWRWVLLLSMLVMAVCLALLATVWRGDAGLPGRLTISAIQTRDYPLVQGCVLLISLSYVCVNLLTDLAYASVDPRIRFE